MAPPARVAAADVRPLEMPQIVQNWNSKSNFWLRRRFHRFINQEGGGGKFPGLKFFFHSPSISETSEPGSVSVM